MSVITVEAGGDICLRTITSLAAELRRAFDDGGDVRLDMTAVAAPDLSTIQLIQAARRTAAAKDVDFALTAPATPVLAAVLDRAGFLAAASPDDTHFWFHGELPQ
ncbi:MAG: hypothetical protein DI544_07750 [Sphingomonas taxi]|uniref:STAS domain-containing protein n=1 Tax=Sphingomonas taxi TaxID=1549858 RepID=A0A2W5R0L7_9SPHN|nr:MAG: hypothetical protein DI544_07750 [Sphingomonas taxi]